MSNLNLSILIRAIKTGVDSALNATKNAIKGVGQETENTGQKAGLLSSAFDGLKGAMGGLLAGIGLKQLIDTNREFEQLRTSLITATGSAEQASVAFDAIQQFAAETPYSVQEVTQAFIKLKNLGLDPSEKALTSYGNTAAATGKTLEQVVAASIDATRGRFAGLEETYGVYAKSARDRVEFTFRGVTTSVAKSADEIQNYLLKIGQTEFAGKMREQSASISGAVQDLEDQWKHLLDEVISDRAAGEISSLSSVIQTLIRGLGDALNWVATDGISHFQGAFVSGLATIQNSFTLLSATAKIAWAQIAGSGRVALNEVQEIAASIMQGMASAFDSIGADDKADYWRKQAEAMRPVTDAYHDMGQEIADITAKANLEMATRREAAQATVAAIQKETAAHKEKKRSLDELSKAQQAVADEDRQQQKEVQALSKAYRAGEITLEQYAQRLGQLSQGKRAATQASQDQAGAEKDLAKTLGETTDSLSKNYDRMLEASKAYRDGAISAKEFNAAVTAQIEANEKLRKAAQEAREAEAKKAEEAKQAAEAQKESTNAQHSAVQAQKEEEQQTRRVTISIEAMAEKYGVAKEAVDLYGQAVARITSGKILAGDLGMRALEQIYADTAAAVKGLTAAQAEFEARTSSAATGVQSLEQRLLELTGTERQIAQAKRAAERQEIDLQIERLTLQQREARLTGNNDQAAKLEREIGLYQQQLGLLQRIQGAEQLKAARDGGRRAESGTEAEARRDGQAQAQTATPNQPATGPAQPLFTQPAKTVEIKFTAPGGQSVSANVAAGSEASLLEILRKAGAVTA